MGDAGFNGILRSIEWAEKFTSRLNVGRLDGRGSRVVAGLDYRSTKYLKCTTYIYKYIYICYVYFSVSASGLDK